MPESDSTKGLRLSMSYKSMNRLTGCYRMPGGSKTGCREENARGCAEGADLIFPSQPFFAATFVVSACDAARGLLVTSEMV